MIRTLALIGGLLAFVDYFGAVAFWFYSALHAVRVEMRRG